ncbi:hypothetical protein PGB90_007249 [Kerria lacca]
MTLCKANTNENRIKLNLDLSKLNRSNKVIKFFVKKKKKKKKESYIARVTIYYYK